MPAQRTDEQIAEQIAELRKQLDKSVPDTSTEEQLYWHAMWRNRILQYLPALLALAERPSNGGAASSDIEMNFIYHVDDKQYTFPTDRATGSQIKSRIPYYNPSYLLVLERSGTNDLVVNNNDYVGLSPPTRFYTVPPATFSSLRPSNGEVEAMAKRLDGYRALCGLSEIGSVIEGAAALLRKLSAGESGGTASAPPTPDVEVIAIWKGKRIRELEADLAAARNEWNELNAINKTLEVERNAALASSEADRAALTRCLETQRMIEAANAKLRARLVEAASGVDAALGMIEEDNYIPDWDLLRKIRTRARAALAAEGGET